MTPKQKQRIAAAENESRAAGGKLTHRLLGNGTVLVADTHGSQKTLALVGTDGDYIDPTFSDEVRIFLAYEKLSSIDRTFTNWVDLVDLRPKLKAIARAKQDAAFKRMILTGEVHLTPDSSRNRNTEAALKAAYQSGSEKLNWIAITTDYDPIG